VFTISDFGNGKGAAFGAGCLFHAVAEAVICHGEEARLSRKEVRRYLEMCRDSKEFFAPLEKVAGVFGEEKEIAIIGNEALSLALKEVATPLARKVSDANGKEIRPQIQALFGIVVHKEQKQ
jgi:hypothetical protein